MNEISPAHIDTGIMSINVDKMDSKHNDSLHKPKPVVSIVSLLPFVRFQCDFLTVSYRFDSRYLDETA